MEWSLFISLPKFQENSVRFLTHTMASSTKKWNLSLTSLQDIWNKLFFSNFLNTLPFSSTNFHGEIHITLLQSKIFFLFTVDYFISPSSDMRQIRTYSSHSIRRWYLLVQNNGQSSRRGNIDRCRQVPALYKSRFLPSERNYYTYCQLTLQFLENRKLH